jgi:DNA-binding transcriptional LysR family regulator
MDIRQLKVVEAVYKAGSVTAAAHILHVSQPAISKTMRQVEEETGLVLFENVNGRLVATEQAHALIPVIERLMSGHESVKQRIEDLRTGRRGLVKIASAPSLTSTLLAEAIRRFKAEKPFVDLKVFAASTREVVERVARNDVDIGTCQPSSGDSAVNARLISTGRVICVMPGSHRLASKATVSPMDLEDEDVITFPDIEPTGARISEAFVSEGVRLKKAIEVNQSYGACSFVDKGLGVALVDSFIHTHGHFPTLSVRPFAPEIRIQTHMLISSIRPISALAEEFCAKLLEVGREFQPSCS